MCVENIFFKAKKLQMRDSPHIHMLIWLEHASAFGCDDDDVVTSFIDKIITTEFTRGPGRGDTCHLSFLDETLPD